MRGDAVARLEVVLAVVADLRVAGVAAAEPARPLLARGSTSSACAGRGCRRRCPGCAGAARRRAPAAVATAAYGASELGAGDARRASSSRRSGRPRRRPSIAAEPGVLQVDERASATRMPRSIWPARSVPPASTAAPSLREQLERLVERAGPCVRAHASASSTRSRVSGSAAARRPVAWRERVRDRRRRRARSAARRGPSRRRSGGSRPGRRGSRSRSRARRRSSGACSRRGAR